jgi:hypothetical protein
MPTGEDFTHVITLGFFTENVPEYKRTFYRGQRDDFRYFQA